MRDPLNWRIDSSSSRGSSRGPAPFELNTISPEMRAGGGSRRMIASDVTDFPEPDSPTSPRTSPGAIEKPRSRTAGNDSVETAAIGCPTARAAEFAPCTGNSMLRWRMSSREGTVHGSRTKKSPFWATDSRGRLSPHTPGFAVTGPRSAAGHFCCCRLLPLWSWGSWLDFRSLRCLSTPAETE